MKIYPCSGDLMGLFDKLLGGKNEQTETHDLEDLMQAEGDVVSPPADFYVKRVDLRNEGEGIFWGNVSTLLKGAIEGDRLSKENLSDIVTQWRLQENAGITTNKKLADAVQMIIDGKSGIEKSICRPETKKCFYALL